MQYTLSNDLLTVVIDSKGAELQSILNNRTGHQYLWQGDATYWGRRSPVLFPFVGAVAGGQYRHGGNSYPMSQHGFARDMEFKPMETANADEDAPASAWFYAEADEKTHVVYPFDWRLEIGYTLDETRITVSWRVINRTGSVIPFQIGAHPAFNYPDYSPTDEVHGYMMFDKRGDIHFELIERDGCLGHAQYPLTIDSDGMLPLTPSTFDRDAIIIGDNQIHRVSMLTKQRTPYLTLLFRSPAVGLWSKANPRATFVCIEPWWGRCDRVDFDGELQQREYINLLDAGATFDVGYMIIIDNI